VNRLLLYDNPPPSRTPQNCTLQFFPVTPVESMFDSVKGYFHIFFAVFFGAFLFIYLVALADKNQILSIPRLISTAFLILIFVGAIGISLSCSSGLFELPIFGMDRRTQLLG
jgi:hypothetical protein